MTWNLRSFHLFSFHKRQKTFYPVCSLSLYPAQLGRQSSLGWLKAFFASFVFHSHVTLVLICPRLLLSCGRWEAIAIRREARGCQGPWGLSALWGNLCVWWVPRCCDRWDAIFVGRWSVSVFQVISLWYIVCWLSLAQFKKNLESESWGGKTSVF